MILEQADRSPRALALDDGTRQRSFEQLVERGQRHAALFRDAGLGDDDHAAMVIGNRAEFYEALLGAFLAGIWLTPVNWHLTAEEISYIVADSGARLLLTDADHEATARDALERAQLERPLLVAGGSLEDALASAKPHAIDLAATPGGTMMYTSGTTGHPKGVKRSRPGTLREAFEGHAAYGRRIGLDGSGPHLTTGPLYHAAPGMFAFYDMANGAPLLILPRWDEHAFLRIVAEREVRHTHLVPTMFSRLLKLPADERDAANTSSLEVVLHGAAPISEKQKRRMIDWWGPILVEYWGGTEGGVTTLVESAEWLAHPGTVGRCVDGYEVFAVDDAGRPLPVGEVGALYSRHPRVPHFFEYHRAPEKTAASYLDDYSFTLGDVGWVDADGFLFLADRKTNMIISGGVNVYPQEIEQVLQEHPAVADVGVFGVPDEDWGESVKAAIQLAPGREPDPAQEEAILAFAREHLAGYKVPRSIDFHGELPRTPAGKLYVRRLRDPYWAGRERAI